LQEESQHAKVVFVATDIWITFVYYCFSFNSACDVCPQTHLLNVTTNWLFDKKGVIRLTHTRPRKETEEERQTERERGRKRKRERDVREIKIRLNGRKYPRRKNWNCWRDRETTVVRLLGGLSCVHEKKEKSF